jgi:aryl-alcohol dehydrogenase
VGINQGDAVPRESIPALVELHRQGRFPFDELIRVYPFEDIQQAADDAAAGTVVKPVLRMPASD